MVWGALAGAAISAAGSLIGGKKSAESQADIAQQNYENQKEFAQNGIRWKVADAKAAGIHPLFALNGNTSSYTPVAGYGGDNGISDAASQFGQGIGRAAESMMTKQERQAQRAKQEMNDVFDLAVRQQELEAGRARITETQLRNKILADQVATQKLLSERALRRGQNPGMPGLDAKGKNGQGDSPNFDDPINELGTLRGPDGRLTDLVPGQDYAQLYEDKAFIEWIPAINAFIRDYYAKLGGSSGVVGNMKWNPKKGSYEKYVPRRFTRSGRFSGSRANSVQIHNYMY